MAKSIIIIVLALVFAGIAWLSAGRRLTLLLDRVVSVNVRPLPVSPLSYDGGGFLIGDLSMTFGATNNLVFPLCLSTSGSGFVTLSAGNRDFILGPRTNPSDGSGRPELDFIPEPGDQLSFVTNTSLLAWPTPFEIRFMGGPSPWWRRYVYYRLHWKKRSGANLEMAWRYGQQFLAASGWSSPVMMWDSQTGLLSVDIHPASPALEDAVAQYIAKTKGWKRSEYRIEDRGPGPDANVEEFAVVCLCDEQNPVPGAGHSVRLDVDRASGRVTREQGYQ